MLISRAIERIKKSSNDISDEYENEKCIDFLNNALQQVSALLIGARFPVLVKEISVRNGDSLPNNFMICAGTYPLRMTNGRVEIVDSGVEVIKFRYFATPENLTVDSKELPFSHDAINEVIVRAAMMLALNENEYDLTQDNVLLDKLQQAISSAMQ